MYKKTSLRELKKILNQISLYQLDTDIKNEFLVYILFDMQIFKTCTIKDIEQDFLKIVEYCLEYQLINMESGIPDSEYFPNHNDLKPIIFQSDINSELLNLFQNYLSDQDKKYFKFPNDIPELRLSSYSSNPNFLDEWRQYLNL